MIHSDNEQKLINAAYDGNLDEVKRLVGLGIDVNTRNEFDDRTPLHEAACNGHTDICEFLLAKGADIEAKDIGGLTPLHDAARWEHTNTLKLLLFKSTDINTKDENGWTPLHYASWYKFTDMCELLIDAGANPYLKNNDGDTAIDWCTNEEKKYMIENGPV